MTRLFRTPERCYLAMGAVLALLMLGNTVNHLWPQLDTWVWLGPIREFAERPWSPGHPLVAVDAPDPYMGPYSFLLGGIVRLTGADPIDVFAVAGMVNLGLFLAGLWYFVRSLSTRPWAPPLTLAFTLLGWGWSPWRWSGYPNLDSLGSGLPLGSTFTYALALFTLGAWWRWLTAGQWRHLVIVAACYPTALLTHQATALWLTLIALAFLLARVVALDAHTWATTSVALLVAAAFIVAWPYYSIVELFTSFGGFDASNMPTYRHVVLRSFLASPGLVILGGRLKRNRSDHLAFATLLVGAVFVYGWFVDKGSLGRVFPGLMLMSHLAMADWVAGRPDLFRRHTSPRVGPHRAPAFALAALLVVGLAGTAPGWLRAVPRQFVSDDMAARLRLGSRIDPNIEFARYLQPDDIVAADVSVALEIGGYSAKVISVDVPEPFIDDTLERSAAVGALLNPATDPAVQNRLIAEYGADWFVVSAQAAPPLLAVLPDAQLVAEVNGYALIELAPD